jgi:hypothetical protein
VQNAERQGKKQRIEEMAQFLKNQTSELLEFDDQLVRKVIEKITVFDGKVTVEFKSSFELDIEI